MKNALSSCALLIAGLLTAALPAAAAEVTFMIGSVDVERGGTWTGVATGTPLQEGDSIRTGAGSLAILALNDGSMLKLSENTVLRIDRSGAGANTELELTAGSVFSRIIKKTAGEGFRLRAQTVVASVRGTEFFTAYGKTAKNTSDIWLCVNEGSVEVTSAAGTGKELVTKGKGIFITGKGGITPPKEYKWTKELNWNMNPAAGTVKDATNILKAYGDLTDHNYD
ncbi:MAG: hypothetical protein EPN93_15065 [Spirochaetes bacterium]|nr:MAG: hypothetical protein EPN93_15065 [Spirochaetota bacterium]